MMKQAHTYRRLRCGLRSRGFTIVEGMVASLVFTLSLIGVGVLTSMSSRTAADGAMNVEFAQMTRRMLQEFTLAPAALPAPGAMPNKIDFGVYHLPSGRTFYREVEIADGAGDTGVASTKVTITIVSFAYPVDWNAVAGMTAAERQQYGERVYKNVAYVSSNY